MKHMNKFLSTLPFSLFNLLWFSGYFRLESAFLGSFFDCLDISLFDPSFKEAGLLHSLMKHFSYFRPLPFSFHNQISISFFVMLNFNVRYLITLRYLVDKTLKRFSVVNQQHEINQNSWVYKVKQKAINRVPNLNCKLKLTIISFLFSSLESALRAVLRLLLLVIPYEWSDFHLI